jgi:hypothetical protein
MNAMPIKITGRLVQCLLIVAAVLVSLVTAFMPAKAEAVSCHVFTSSVAGVTDWGFYTPTYTVPSSSGCRDIIVAAINSSNRCATMQVQFFPSSGGSTWGSEKYVCSSSINTVRVLATGVANGTRYKIWVWYPDTAMGVRFNYKIVD